ncbi:protein kinase 4 isoform X3 [Eupeodes corollae]|uniref:protein kinase 4 isoform X3 n=1 Tax=Eupeodes corollae TaxID=290404 RepID=UPI00248F7242|nr:protein kinase 4 isoform X3 [Eupeodes corollae]
MNGMNNSNDDVAECPLCMEPLEVDDLNFYPCTCGYQICRFCWHRIRTDENELCPACRKAYPENPADFTPLTQEEMVALKSKKRQRDQQRKQKITENRKHLANVRVVQKNLVFVVGLPPRLADADVSAKILKRHEYFGKYGKIHKVVINPSTTYAGVQGPSASAYVTYVHNCDALRAIQSVNNISIDGRLIKTSLGTTKYCSHFMKNQQCPKGDCMYLHELGDPEASFTKEEMHQGKHQEYEKRLHDQLIASSGPNGVPGEGGSSTGGNPGTGATTNAIGTGGVPVKDAWPSLSVSPTNTKELTNGSGSGGGGGSSGGKKEKGRGKKSKGEKAKKNNNSSSNKEQQTNNNSSNSNTTQQQQQNQQQINGTKDSGGLLLAETTKSLISDNNKKSSEKSSMQQQQQQNNQQMAGGKLLQNDTKSNHLSVEDEMKLIEDFEKDNGDEDVEEDVNGEDAYARSMSSSSSNSSDQRVSPFLSESLTSSGNSSPGSFPDHHTTIPNTDQHLEPHIISNNISSSSSSSSSSTSSGSNQDTNSKLSSSSSSASTPASPAAELNQTTTSTTTSVADGIVSPTPTSVAMSSPAAAVAAAMTAQKLTNIDNSSNIIDTTACLSKLNLFDDNNSFFSSSSSFQPFLKGKLDTDMRNIQNNHHLSSAITSHLPDLLNDFPSISNNLHSATDLSRLSQSALIQHQTQQLLQQQLQQERQQTDHLLSNNLFGTNMSRFFDFHKNQQQQQQLHQFVVNGHGNNSQINDHARMASLLENNRINSQFLDHTNGLIGQQPVQKQRLAGKYDPMAAHNLLGTGLANSVSQSQVPTQQAANATQPAPSLTQQQPQQTPSRLLNQFSTLNSSVDDDLGFDPFIETQKALAELMENEMVQQQTAGHQKHLLESVHRARMPPPGFNHMNAFGFGVPRAQSSKILPFMNMNGGGQQQQQPPQQQQPSMSNQQQPNNWNAHLGPFQQQQLPLDPQMHMSQQNQNGGNLNKGYSNMSDWTAMDPAILSFRQFSSFPQQQQQQQPQQQQPLQHHPQQQQQQHTGPDMFMQHLTQQNNQGFGPQPPQHLGVNLPNNLLNPQQNSQAQVNYPQIANWLSNEQNLFMNSLANGFVTNSNSNNPLNGYNDKFTISMPPGLLSNNLNTQQQTTECIN